MTRQELASSAVRLLALAPVLYLDGLLSPPVFVGTGVLYDAAVRGLPLLCLGLALWLLAPPIGRAVAGAGDAVPAGPVNPRQVREATVAAVGLYVAGSALATAAHALFTPVGLAFYWQHAALTRAEFAWLALQFFLGLGIFLGGRRLRRMVRLARRY